MEIGKWIGVCIVKKPRCKKKLLACCCVLAAGLVGLTVWGASTLRNKDSSPEAVSQPNRERKEVLIQGALEGFTPEELKEKSHLVIAGTVTGISTPFMIEAVPGPCSNFTDYYVTVSEVLRGDAQAGDTVTVRVEGGEAGPFRVISEVDPVLAQGDECLLFLFRHNVGGGYNTQGDYYWILGRIQGAYLKEEGGEEYWSMFGEDTAFQLDALAAEMEVINREHPVDPGWVRRELEEALEGNLERGMITQEEYEEGYADLERYATVMTDSQGELLPQYRGNGEASHGGETSQRDVLLMP